MAVRNFWIKADIDGRKTKVEGGPRAKDGGFTLTIYIRSEGSVEKALTIDGLALSNGQLEVNVFDDGKAIHSVRRNR